ncbi:hypothetical protein BALH_1119 [Bacillus thuringiensis str. Al Hakam]|nr:hypothetical protein BALH_1119 [Bacillus thuringiensis str. Al Hakam]
MSHTFKSSNSTSLKDNVFMLSPPFFIQIAYLYKNQVIIITAATPDAAPTPPATAIFTFHGTEFSSSN